MTQFGSSIKTKDGSKTGYLIKHLKQIQMIGIDQKKAVPSPALPFCHGASADILGHYLSRPPSLIV
jgi:hypothetical protein